MRAPQRLGFHRIETSLPNDITVSLMSSQPRRAADRIFRMEMIGCWLLRRDCSLGDLVSEDGGRARGAPQKHAGSLNPQYGEPCMFSSTHAINDANLTGQLKFGPLFCSPRLFEDGEYKRFWLHGVYGGTSYPARLLSLFIFRPGFSFPAFESMTARFKI